MSALENRVLNVIKSETHALRLQMGKLEQSNVRLENAMAFLKSDVTRVKMALETIRGNLNITHFNRRWQFSQMNFIVLKLFINCDDILIAEMSF